MANTARRPPRHAPPTPFVCPFHPLAICGGRMDQMPHLSGCRPAMAPCCHTLWLAACILCSATLPLGSSPPTQNTNAPPRTTHHPCAPPFSLPSIRHIFPRTEHHPSAGGAPRAAAQYQHMSLPDGCRHRYVLPLPALLHAVPHQPVGVCYVFSSPSVFPSPHPSPSDAIRTLCAPVFFPLKLGTS